MKIAPPADDAHLDLLVRRNRSDAAVPISQQVEPIARPENLTTEESARNPERPPVERRQGGDRRQGDRRRRDQDVLLDTRAPQERRRQLRRREDRERLAAQASPDAPEEAPEEAPAPRRGIDVFV